MCGIAGITVLTKKSLKGETLGSELTVLLKSLEYRGYDSVGIAVISDGRLVVRKGAGKIDEVSRKLGFRKVDGLTGIGHTRWATHGPPNDINAHPHTDCNGKIAVAHNGIIKNYYELKKEAIMKGHTIKSDTDTEIISHLLEENYTKTNNFLEALSTLLDQIEGSYALVILNVDEPDKIYFAKNLSPLVIGIGNGDYNLVASDIPALLRYTNRVVTLRDGEYGYITPSKIHILKKRKPVNLAGRIKTIDWTIESISRAGYPHFMIKEIHEQPLALRETYFGISSDPLVDEAVRILSESRLIYITGAGTSFHAGLVGRYMFSKFASRPAIPFISSEYTQVINEISEKDVLIAISQSGETIDTLRAVRWFKASGGKIIAISNVIESAIPRESDLTLYTRAGPEIGVAATKTYLTQVLVLTYLSLGLAKYEGMLTKTEYHQKKNSLRDAWRFTEESIRQTEPLIKSLAKSLSTAQSIYILGRGLGSLLALEAALKIKEIDYIHAEAYPAGESKHGPIALVEPGFPVLFIDAIDGREELIGNIKEMTARGADAYITTCKSEELGVHGAQPITIPCTNTQILEPYVHIPVYQLLSYYIAVQRGLDPDKPRNLAKTVTVE
ncbi:MAG: glutamine--fructose-6-phosphate transaminase (isomerizing) [Desulfurococcales archaeon]|nr:glutamine--fructose-6-phosphate transaminase (isomerizing) [Desulfurococcales archaeon]